MTSSHEIDPDQASIGAASRRVLLAGMATAGAGLMLGGGAEAQGHGAPGAGPAASQGLIDVHYHIAPPPWAAALKDRHLLHSAWNGWSPAKAIEDMDRDGIALSVVSITTPGVWFGDKAGARRLARECNDYAARLAADHPGRFGVFGVLPLPDVDGSLQEIAYALDTLKADGIGLYTSYGDKWLGDPMLTPIFDELNRRKALVYTHPTTADCCRNLLPGLPPALIEFGTDTTRAIAQIVFSGAGARYTDMPIIFSHAGGTMPFLYERFVTQARNPKRAQQLPADPLAPLKRFYYDTAQSSMAPPMAALRRVVPVSHILFGTDYPYRTAAEHIEELHQSEVFTPEELQGIERGNALALLHQRHA